MGGDDIGVWIIGRVLHWAETVDLIVIGNNDHATGMLASGALDTGAALDQSIFFGIGDSLAALLQEMLNIAKSGLILNGTNSTCFEHMVTAK